MLITRIGRYALRMRGLALLLALVACTRAHESKDPPPPTPIPTPPTPVPAPPIVESRTLVIQAHTHDSPEAAYLAVTLAADPSTEPTLVDLGKRPADAMPTPGYYRALAATDGDHLVHVRDKTKLVVAALAGGTRTIDVAPLEPRGIHVTGSALYVGSDKTVCWIDLAKPAPCRELVNRSNYAYKAYDRFVRLGDRLLAIDDEVSPMFADWFSIDSAGRPIKRVGDWKLPDVINGHYEHAALLATAANEYTLYLVAPYSVLSGSGHDLVAIPVRADKLVFDPDLTLQNRDFKTPILEEHVDRPNNQPDTLLAGTKYSPWTGLAVAPRANKVLIAAGVRGMLTVPTDFAPSHKTATADLLGGIAVVDVRVQAGHVLALVHRAHTPDTTVSDLVFLDPTSLKPIARHMLGNGSVLYDRFVD